MKWELYVLCFYLLGSTFLLLTDHKPLHFLNSMKDANAQIMRLYFSLQPYDFIVHPRPGKTHKHVVFLGWREMANRQQPHGSKAEGQGV